MAEQDALALGLFLGLIGAVAAYHLLMYAVLRVTDFLAYGAYLVGLVWFQLARSPGIFPDPHLRERAFWWSFAVLALLGYWLFRVFLDLPRRQPRLDRGFASLTTIAALAAVGAPFLPAGYGRGVELLALTVLTCAGAALIGALRGGVRVARYFGIAYAGLFAGAVARFAWRAAGEPAGPLALLPAYGIETGSVFQALTLALGIADRIALANEERDRAQRHTIEQISSLNVAYARFVPRAFLELLGKSDVRDVALGDGIERDLTVLFSDVRSFTTLSEAMTPGETFGFINELLARTGPAVREHGGIVDKYVGDAIMALFPGPADEAVRAGIAVQAGVAAVNAARRARGELPIAVGVGLHRGPVMLGTIGEAERMDGTVIADAVNAASRVEGLTKYYGAAIIVSETVQAALADPDAYAMRFLGRVAVQGRRNGIGIYEVLDGERPEVRMRKLASAAAFASALEAFSAGEFDAAAPQFAALAAADPDDGAASYLAGRAAALAHDAGPWEGVDHAAK